MACPICEGPTHDSGSCSCGYDFATGDARVAYERAKTALDRTNPQVHRWLGVVGSAVPVIFFTASAPYVWVWVLGALFVGVPKLLELGGTQEDAALRIKRAEQLMLPPARVVR